MAHHPRVTLTQALASSNRFKEHCHFESGQGSA